MEKIRYGSYWSILSLFFRKMGDCFGQLSVKSPDGHVQRDRDCGHDKTFPCTTSWSFGGGNTSFIFGLRHAREQ